MSECFSTIKLCHKVACGNWHFLCLTYSGQMMVATNRCPTCTNTCGLLQVEDRVNVKEWSRTRFGLRIFDDFWSRAIAFNLNKNTVQAVMHDLRIRAVQTFPIEVAKFQFSILLSTLYFLGSRREQRNAKNAPHLFLHPNAPVNLQSPA